MTQLRLQDNGERVGVVRVSDNSVSTRQFDNENLDSLFSQLGGLTEYTSDPPEEDDISHIDERTAMRESQVVANVKALANARGLGVTDA